MMGPVTKLRPSVMSPNTSSSLGKFLMKRELYTWQLLVQLTIPIDRFKEKMPVVFFPEN